MRAGGLIHAAVEGSSKKSAGACDHPRLATGAELASDASRVAFTSLMQVPL
jgi:hypothetical protein